MSVSLDASIIGSAAASSSRAAASTACVRAVGWGSVCERVAREKSSKRRRSTTVRPTRLAARRRRVTRSTSATSSVSISPGDRRVRPARAASRSSGGAAAAERGAGRGCWRGRGRGAPRAGPRMTVSVGSGNAREVADGGDAALVELRRRRRPDPQTRSTGSGCRKASSRPGGTTRRPSGLATALATLARNFVRATPTVTGRPISSRARRREPDGDLRRRAGDPLHAADVEEGLVDRQPLHERASCPRRARRAPCSPRCTRPCAAGPRPPRGRAGAPDGRPSPCGRRAPSPRSWRPARRRRRRSPAARAGPDRHAARPTRRTSRHRRGGSSRPLPRTYVLIDSRRLRRRLDLGVVPDETDETPDQPHRPMLVAASDPGHGGRRHERSGGGGGGGGRSAGRSRPSCRPPVRGGRAQGLAPVDRRRRRRGGRARRPGPAPVVEAAGDDVDPRAKSLALADAGERACDGASVAELGRAPVQGAREEESLGVRDPAPALGGRRRSPRSARPAASRRTSRSRAVMRTVSALARPPGACPGTRSA